MNCPNCNTALSCGCQKRIASDGAQVCSSCIAAYEQRLAAQKKP
jgi:hypothetical protein